MDLSISADMNYTLRSLGTTGEEGELRNKSEAVILRLVQELKAILNYVTTSGSISEMHGVAKILIRQTYTQSYIDVCANGALHLLLTRDAKFIVVLACTDKKCEYGSDHWHLVDFPCLEKVYYHFQFASIMKGLRESLDKAIRKRDERTESMRRRLEVLKAIESVLDRSTQSEEIHRRLTALDGATS